MFGSFSLEAVCLARVPAMMKIHPGLHAIGASVSSALNQPGSSWFGQLFTSSTNIFDPRSVPAHQIFRLSIFVLIVTGAIFFTVSGLLIHVIVRYRHRPEDSENEPAQIYGSNQIELAWTVIPVLIVIVLFLSTARIIFSIQHAREPKHGLNVTVVGHQWWWEFRYPDYGVVTANELHVPVASDPKHPMPTYLKLATADVNHSFWVPRLNGKTDMFAGQVNRMWIQPQETGLYLGQCAQYCGEEHARMLIRVYAQTPAEFQKWIVNQQKNAVQDPSAEEGRAVFERNACINCHTIRGTVANGRFGPDLTHLMSRTTIGAETLPNTQTNLEAWIKDPDFYKPGCLMPAMKLSDQDIAKIVSYLVTLH
ncbi:MAG: cytochrome c oxidase subunit II [Acidobacteriaceae bacterium]